MKFYIDGNNLASYLFKEKNEEDKREKTLNFLLTKNLPKISVLVFDGPEFRLPVTKGGLHIIFSKDKKADEVIIQKIKKGDYVITDDVELQRKCKFKKAKFMEIRKFLARIEHKEEIKEKPLQEQDIEMWMKIFSSNKDGS